MSRGGGSSQACAGGHVIDGEYAREITVTDRRVHLPSAALALAEQTQELHEYQSQLLDRARMVQETEARHAHVLRQEAHEVVRRAELGIRESRELEEYQGQLAARARMIQNVEARHSVIIQEEAQTMSNRFSEGQQHDRQVLAAQLAGAQSSYASQARVCTDEMRGAVAMELQNLRAMEQQVQYHMNANEQRCAHEVNAARDMAREEVREAMLQNSRNMREVSRLEVQEQEAAHPVLLRQQRLLVGEQEGFGCS